MYYPEFIKEKEMIGICAPSAGKGDKLADYLNSLKFLKSQNYKIKETKSVRNKGVRSTTAKKRAQELEELFLDKKVKLIMCATGGDFMYEILPYINFDNLINNPKWIMGYSDPTNILFPLTTKYDIATLYGFNSGYDFDNKQYQKDNLNILKGNIVKQQSFKYYQEFIETINDIKEYKHKVYWQSKKELSFKGRIIGGCLDVLSFLMNTPYDGTKEFIERYKNDGIIWYFDNFALSAENTYLTLLQFKNAGYFKYCKGILIGRVAFPSFGGTGLTYEKAYSLALKNIPYISEMDIGHTNPRMTIINGSICEAHVDKGKGYIKQYLK